MIGWVAYILKNASPLQPHHEEEETLYYQAHACPYAQAMTLPPTNGFIEAKLVQRRYPPACREKKYDTNPDNTTERVCAGLLVQSVPNNQPAKTTKRAASNEQNIRRFI